MKDNEVEVFALHITQKNSLAKVMCSKVATIFKKYDAAITPSINPYKILITLLFRTTEERLACGKELEQNGIVVAYEKVKTYVDKKYFDEVQ